MANLNLRSPTSYDGQLGTQYKQGAVRLATDAEVTDGTSTVSAVTPAQLATAGVGANFASPAAIGSTTPAAGTFTTLTATGNIVLSSVATQIQMNGGAATDFIGTATLALGTSGAIANTNIAAGDRIFIQRVAANLSTTLGELSYTISAGASFTINSLIIGTPGSPQTGDLSTVAYVIIRQT